MKKRIIAAVLALMFVASTAGTVFAARLKCTVDSVEGDKVTMTCENADQLKPGDKPRVSPPKGGAIEGC
ncbi:selenite/tellurite reduction operon protein ExtJ [Desulfofustis glycolicus]|jgi:hypothetical protein|uniref:Secreted protein n=1 Tax=Desulfofustis glycolicus DSM 9705 TaxID=1121409 RepID=A0A1M5UHU7_9BACT|nr:hypothetical protein [Desulfofustis glycolicus]MCB2217480.1 hypothetical protein [Desulfobulbaceae bacterium]SHH62537.1 hypothetical protein SAMN02745124_01170 [Desulfofustis glycolicus DSM 9705]